MSKYKFSYDGFGINDANDEYKRRILTFSSDYTMRHGSDAVGNLVAAAPEMLDALKKLIDRANDSYQMEYRGYGDPRDDQSLDIYRKLINKAEGN